MSELKGFTLMLRVELLVRDQTLVLCLKAALTFGKNSWNQLKKLCLFSQVHPAIISPFSFLHTNVTALLNNKQSTPTLLFVVMDFRLGNFHIF